MEHLFTEQHHGRPTFLGVIIMSVVLVVKFLTNSETIAALTSISLFAMTVYYVVQTYLMVTKRWRENKKNKRGKY